MKSLTYRIKNSVLITVLLAKFLSACGGGGAISSTNTVPRDQVSAEQTTGIQLKVDTQLPTSRVGLNPSTSLSAAAPTVPNAPSASTESTIPAILRAPIPSAPVPVIVVPISKISGALTVLKIESVSQVEQTNVPITVGQAFKQGQVLPTDRVTGKLADGTAFPLQVDVKAVHADGSLRHAIISSVIPRLPAGHVHMIEMVKSSTAADSTNALPTHLTNSGFTSSVNFTVGGQVYTASADALLTSGQYKTWLSGPIANEWHVSTPLKTSAGVAHPHLTARFAIRSYAGLNKARVDVTIENAWAFEPNPQNFTYDAQVLIGGQTVYSKVALTHYHHARWRKIFWWGAAPQVNIKHDAAYLIASKALPNYDTSITPSAAALSDLANSWSNAKTGPMEPGIVNPYMPGTGARPDIGPLPQWAALYLLSMDSRAKNVTLGIGDLAGSWPIHYRDKQTDRPVSLTRFPYMTLTGNPGDTINPATRQSEAFPACIVNCSTAPNNYTPDSSHQPSMAYLPYLITGDYYYLEELQFWASWNMFQSNPGYRGQGQGLLKVDQVRGQAWSLRTLGQAAYITPDNDAMKQYFMDRVGYNLDWYNTTYTMGNPNQLGAIDGSGDSFPAIAYPTPAGPQTGLAPWMDDFFTWSVGHLAELGFSNAQPLLKWKAKFPVGRLTAPGYCWIDATQYTLTVRPNQTSPVYSTFREAYLATVRNMDGTALTNSKGAYLDKACGSPAQADWLTQADTDARTARNPWQPGEMVGYAPSTAGYPSNLQPALAVAVASGIPNAQTAWNIFMNRSVKPDYRINPQWAIVPRE